MTLDGGTNSANLSRTEVNYSSLIAQINPSTSSSNGVANVLCGGTLSNLSITLSGESEYVFAVVVNGSSSALRCITLRTTCTNTTDSITLVAGDKVNLRAVPSPGMSPQGATWSTSYARNSGSGPEVGQTQGREALGPPRARSGMAQLGRRAPDQVPSSFKGAFVR